MAMVEEVTTIKVTTELGGGLISVGNMCSNMSVRSWTKTKFLVSVTPQLYLSFSI